MTYESSPVDSITVGTSSVNLLAEVPINQRRSQFIICNTSTTQKITIAKKGTSAELGKGIVLNPSGSYAESTDSGYKCYQGPVQAISDVAGGTVSITESFE